MVGTRFGRLVVLRDAPRNKRSRRMMECLCDCGNVHTTQLSSLQFQLTRSCGCLRGEKLRGRTRTPLGSEAGSVEHRTWRAMMGRCYNSSGSAFADYGGRGITVCDRWRESYPTFLADMGRRPSPTHSIDRIDNAGNYEPGNCRWATKLEQQQNRRTVRWLTFRGRTQVLAQWSKELGIPYGSLWTRLYVKGWSIERAMSEPVRQRVTPASTSP